MVTIDAKDAPAAIVRLVTAASSIGWEVTATLADGPPPTVAVRFGHDGYRAYGVWTLGTTPTGKPSAKWRAGASRSGRYFANLEALRAYLGIAK